VTCDRCEFFIHGSNLLFIVNLDSKLISEADLSVLNGINVPHLFFN
jgi:hypothetical protein